MYSIVDFWSCLPLYTPRHIRNIVNQQRFSQLTNKFVLDFMKFFSSYNGPLMTFCYGRFRNPNVSSFWWHFSRAVCLEDLVLWCSYIKVSLQIDQLLKYKHQNYQTASQDPSVATTFVFSLFFFLPSIPDNTQASIKNRLVQGKSEILFAH